MIEIEIFQREEPSNVHTLKIWVNGNLAFANEIGTMNDVKELQSSLHNELLWVDKYLRTKGFTS